MKTVRLTMAQALVRFLENQYIEVGGEMGCPKCFDNAKAAANEKFVAVQKSLGI